MSLSEILENPWVVVSGAAIWSTRDGKPDTPLFIVCKTPGQDEPALSSPERETLTSLERETLTSPERETLTGYAVLAANNYAQIVTALTKIVAIEHSYESSDWDEITQAQNIARTALAEIDRISKITASKTLV